MSISNASLSVQDITYGTQSIFPIQRKTYEAVPASYNPHTVPHSTFQATAKSRLIDRSLLLQRLAEISTLSDSWDGYGSEKLDGKCILNVESFISALPETIPSPDLYPNSNGTITLEWDFDAGTLSIELGDESFSAFIDNGTSQRHQEDTFQSGIPSFVSLAFQEIFPQPTTFTPQVSHVTTGNHDGHRPITSIYR